VNFPIFGQVLQGLENRPGATGRPGAGDCLRRASGYPFSDCAGSNSCDGHGHAFANRRHGYRNPRRFIPPHGGDGQPTPACPGGMVKITAHDWSSMDQEESWQLVIQQFEAANPCIKGYLGKAAG